MQIESLKVFCDVVRWANVSRAASENGMSQSSASHIVSELERRLGVKLLDRSRRPILPTAEGRMFYEGCKELVSRYYDLEERVKGLKSASGIAGSVRVAAIYSVGLLDMSRCVERFEAQHPGAEVRIEYLHPNQVIEEVREGRAELGLVSFPRKWADLSVHGWRAEEMVLAVNPSHPLASSGPVAVGSLDGERLVGFDPDLAIRRAIDQFLRRHGVTVETSPEFDSIENIKGAVIELPSGASILPRPTLRREIASGSIVALTFADARLSRPLAVVHRRGSELGMAATRFLEHLIGDRPSLSLDGPPRDLNGVGHPSTVGEPT